MNRTGLSKLANMAKFAAKSGNRPVSEQKPAFELHDHGSVCILVPITEAAEEWVFNNLDPEAMRWGPGVAIEPRYVGAILAGIEEDGLRVE